MTLSERYISNDKTVINLPVPLGTKLYYVVLKCGDFCHWQGKKFHETFTESQCFAESPCHTAKSLIYEQIFTLSNLEFVLNNYGIRLFVEKNEAEKVAFEAIKRNREIMSNHGFMMTEDGYGLIKENEGDIS